MKERILIIIINMFWQQRFPKFCFAIHPYRPSLLIDPLELVNISFCWSANIGVPMRSSPYVNWAYEFTFTFCWSYLDDFCDKVAV